MSGTVREKKVRFAPFSTLLHFDEEESILSSSRELVRLNMESPAPSPLALGYGSWEEREDPEIQLARTRRVRDAGRREKKIEKYESFLEWGKEVFPLHVRYDGQGVLSEKERQIRRARLVSQGRRVAKERDSSSSSEAEGLRELSSSAFSPGLLSVALVMSSSVTLAMVQGVRAGLSARAVEGRDELGGRGQSTVVCLSVVYVIGFLLSPFFLRLGSRPTSQLVRWWLVFAACSALLTLSQGLFLNLEVEVEGERGNGEIWAESLSFLFDSSLMVISLVLLEDACRISRKSVVLSITFWLQYVLFIPCRSLSSNEMGLGLQFAGHFLMLLGGLQAFVVLLGLALKAKITAACSSGTFSPFYVRDVKLSHLKKIFFGFILKNPISLVLLVESFVFGMFFTRDSALPGFKHTEGDDVHEAVLACVGGALGVALLGACLLAFDRKEKKCSHWSLFRFRAYRSVVAAWAGFIGAFIVGLSVILHAFSWDGNLEKNVSPVVSLIRLGGDMGIGIAGLASIVIKLNVLPRSFRLFGLVWMVLVESISSAFVCPRWEVFIYENIVEVPKQVLYILCGSPLFVCIFVWLYAIRLTDRWLRKEKDSQRFQEDYFQERERIREGRLRAATW